MDFIQTCVNASEKRDPNSRAIFENMLAHKGEVRAFPDIARDAHVKPYTLYLRAVEQIALKSGYRIEKVDNGVRAISVSIIKYPDGAVDEREREILVTGFRLVDNK